MDVKGPTYPSVIDGLPLLSVKEIKRNSLKGPTYSSVIDGSPLLSVKEIQRNSLKGPKFYVSCRRISVTLGV